MDAFRDGFVNVLVATDVAARGLDIPQVELVIQIEPPEGTESYIHRSGRTGRAGRSGQCITIFEYKNENLMQIIEGKAKIQFEIINMPLQSEIEIAL